MTHVLTVTNIEKLTDQAVSVEFDIPEKLVDQYQFQHGQFVRLTAEIDGQLIVRSYSICSAPYEKKLKVGIKRVEGGVFSNYANDTLKVGDEIEVSVPQGAFTHELNSSLAKNYLLVAAGSGITPIISIIKMVLASEPLSKCTLVYGNKNLESTMFANDIVDLVKKYADRFKLVSVFSNSDQGDFQGRIDFDLLTKIKAVDSVDEFFVCGPKQMSVDIYESMLASGLTADHAHIELFEADNGLSGIEQSNANNLLSKITVRIDGDSFAFDYEDHTRSILEVALDHEPDLPYGCQNGSCGSCQAKVVAGSVEMEVNYALSQSEIDEGLVLVCQSKPTTSQVEFDYDA